MAFNLDGLTRSDEWVGYFPYAPGVDTSGNECMMVVSHDPHASGCNPYYWTVATHNRYGHEFASLDEAIVTAKYAAGSWAVQSVNKDEIKIGAVRFTSVKTAINMGDVV